MIKKLLSAFAMILLLGISRTAFAERAVPVYPDIKIEYIEDVQSTESGGTISLLDESAEVSSDNRYGRSAIGELENGTELVKIYDMLVSGIRNFDETITVSINFDLSIDDAQEFIDVITGSVTQALIGDNPELFWFGKYDSRYHILYGDEIGCVCNSEKKVKSLAFTPQYGVGQTVAAAMTEDMENAANSFIKQADITEGMTDYDKALALHDVVCANLVYDNSQSLEWIHTAYGAFVNKLAVCDGYSKAYQYLLNKVGIDSHIATGSSKGESHAWNLVKLDGEWYYTDVTWDDSEYGIFYEYFNITTELLKEDHELDSSAYKMPDCTATDNWYMKKENIYQTQSSRIDTGKFTELIKANPHVTIYFTDKEINDDIRNIIDGWWEKEFNNIAVKLMMEGVTVTDVSYRHCNREYHFYFFDASKNYISINNENKCQVYINLVDSGNGVLIQSFYDENWVLTNSVLLPIMFNQYDVFKIDMSPDDGFNNYKYIKYMLWRGGTMQPICDMKIAS